MTEYSYTSSLFPRTTCTACTLLECLLDPTRCTGDCTCTHPPVDEASEPAVRVIVPGDRIVVKIGDAWRVATLKTLGNCSGPMVAVVEDGHS